MVLRTRTTSSNILGGSAWHPSDPGGTLTNMSYQAFYHQTLDYHKKLKHPDGSLPTSAFDSTVVERRPPTKHRRNSSSFSWQFNAHEFYETYAPGTEDYPARDSFTRITENNLYALQLVANTHPFVPVYSIPVAIKELAEVAGMFKLSAQSFAGFLGGSYLNYRFGWKAFVNDVRTLAGMMKELEHRIRDFNYLLKHGHTRKQLVLDVHSRKFTSVGVTLNSTYNTIIKGDVIHDLYLKTWGSVTWGVMGDELLPLGELERFNLAVRTLFDLEEIDAETLWNLVPFSWLVDYFYSIGDHLASQHMRYQLQPYDLCIMRHYVHKAVTKVTSKPSTVSTIDGYYRREIKSRDAWTVPPTPSLSFDLLTGDRWKVILALAAKFASK
jgi:hypothetical protein